MSNFIRVFATGTASQKQAHISINTDLIACVTGGGPEYQIILKASVELPGFNREGITITIPQQDTGKKVQLGLL